MEYNKIKSIQKIGKKLVYDIHHNIPTGAFIDDQPNILTEAGLISNCGRHAGGVVLTDSPIEKQNMPLVIGGKGDKRSLQTPWTEGVNFRMLEHFGFLKFDFLALGTLRIFENTVRKILKKQTGRLESEIPFEEVQKWFYEHLSPDKNPMDDINVYKHVFWNGNFISIFQFVKPNTQDFMRRMKPVSVKDISIATSIHRPGPLGLKVDRDFLNNRANPEKIKYEHPFLKEVLEPTSGLLIFQEQLQLIYHHLCGVPLDETDSVRKAFTKKEINNKEKAAKEREKLKTEFIEKTKQFAGMDSARSSIFFDKMESLVSYSFNMSHAISYSIATYQCCWFLTYYPDEWITACLDYAALEKGKVVGQEDPKATAMREAQKLGYKFSKPDINFSSAGYEMHPTKEKVIIPGLTTIDGIGDAALEEINKNKPYKDIKDLLVNEEGKWKHSKFNRKALTNLICLEALDSLNFISDKENGVQNYKQAYNVIVENFDLLKRTSAKKKNNDIVPILDELVQKEKLANTEDWTKNEKIKYWVELAGSADLSLILSEKYSKSIEKMKLKSVDGIRDIDFLEEGENTKITDQVWFILRKMEPKTSKNGKPFLELAVIGEKFSDLIVKIWGEFSEDVIGRFPLYEVYCGTIVKNKYGLSASLGNLASLVEVCDFLFPEEID